MHAQFFSNFKNKCTVANHLNHVKNHSPHIHVLPQKSAKMEDLVSDLDAGSSTLLSWEEEDPMGQFFLHGQMTKIVFRVLYQDRQLETGVERSRQSLMSPSNSAFVYLFNAGQNDALITMKEFDM